jgi:hypothetical protein
MKLVAALLALMSLAGVACDVGAGGESAAKATATPTSPPPAAPRVTIAQLRQASYFFGATAINLADGTYSRPAVLPGELDTYTLREDLVAFADLDGDGDEDAAAFVDFNPWGTGYFPNLVVISNRDGSPAFAASVSLEDRQRVESIRVENGRIVLSLIVHGPGDGRCCPTVARTVSYGLTGGVLVPD